MSDPLDDIITTDPLFSAPAQQAHAVVGATVRTSPSADSNARAHTLSGQTGIPLPVVQRNLPAVEAQQRPATVVAHTAGAPVAQRAYADPHFAAVAHDDSHPVGLWDRLSQVAAQATPLGPARNLVEAGSSLFGYHPGDIVHSAQGAAEQATGKVVQGLGNLGDAALRATTRASDALGGVIPGLHSLRGPTLTQFVAPVSHALNDDSKLLEAKVQQHGRLATVARAVGGIAPYVATGPLAAVSMGLSGAAEQQDRNEEAGQGDSAAGDLGVIGNAFYQGIAGHYIGEVGKLGSALAPEFAPTLAQLTENVPLTIAKALGVGGLKLAGRAAGAGAVGAGMQLGSNAIARETVDPNQSLGQGVADSAAQMALFDVAAHGVHSALGGLHARVRAVAQGEADRNVADGMHLIAEASKVRERTPGVWKDYLHQVTQEHGAPEHVYVSPDAFNQMAETPEGQVALSNMPEAVRDAATVAAQTGGDVRVPVEDFGTHIAGTPLYEQVADHVKFDPNGYTRAEAQDIMQSEGPRVLADLERAIQSKQGSDETSASRGRVEETIKAQLDAAGRASPEVNAINAKLGAASIAAHADRLGMTPEEFHAQHGFGISDGSVRTASEAASTDPNTITASGNYSRGGGPWAASFTAKPRSDGTFGLQRVLDGKTQHLREDGLWHDGEAPTTSMTVGGDASAREQPLSFSTAKDALAHAATEAEGMGGAVHGDANAEPNNRLEQPRDGGTGDQGGSRAPLAGAPAIEGASGPHPELNSLADAARAAGHDAIEQQEGGRTTYGVLERGSVVSDDRRVLYQQQPFFSALDRAVDGISTARAPAQQWLATLKKAPGVKAEELEWTGLEEWLKDQTGPVSKEDVLNAVRNGAVTVEERELGEPQYDHDTLVQELKNRFFESDHFYDYYEPNYRAEEVTEDGDGNKLEEPKWSVVWAHDSSPVDASTLYDDEDAAREAADELDQPSRDEAETEAMDEYVRDNIGDMEATDAEYRSYSLVPDGDNSYREMLLHFPAMGGGVQVGKERTEPPTTHWNAEEGVVAHARYHDRRGPNGEKVLFLDEIQSDWHQRGREQGYNEPADPETQAKAKKAYEDAEAAEAKVLEDAGPSIEQMKAALLPVAQIVHDHIGQSTNIEDRYGTAGQADYALKRSRLRELSAVEPHKNPSMDDLTYFYADLHNEMRRIPEDSPFRQQATDAYAVATEAVKELSEHNRALQEAQRERRLRAAELDIAEHGGNIPNAPFKNTWPILVMKRMIVKAATEGYDQIAWIKQGENNGGMNDNVGWFYEKVLPNEVNKLLKKYGAKVEGLAVVGLKRAETTRTNEIRDEQQRLRGEAVGLQALPYLDDEVRTREKWAAGRAGYEQSIARHQTNIDFHQRVIDAVRAAMSRGEETTTVEGLNHEVGADEDRIKAHENRIDEERQAIELEQQVLDRSADFDKVYAAAKGWQALEGEREDLQKNGPTNLGFKIIDQLRSAAQEGFPLFQGGRDPRGSFEPDTNTINLLKNANLSTFIHELGHYHLETLQKFAASSPEVAADFASALKWMGNLTPEQWAGMSFEEQRPYHEKFAQGFETYLMEGKAPSEALRPVFQRMAAWLKAVYQHMKGLVELTPEVRGVMDRLVATSDEIAKAQESQGFVPAFTAKPEFMSDDQWNAYQGQQQQATADAEEKLQARSIRDMKWAEGAKSRALKDMQRRVAGMRRDMRAEVEKEVNAEPVNRAREFLKRGTLDGQPVEGGNKLSIEAIDAMFPDETERAAVKAKLGYGKYGMLGTENAIDPEIAAEALGYNSARELIRDLTDAPTAAEKIKTETERRLLERHGDVSDPQKMEEAAIQAIHNEARGRVLETELSALRRATGNKNDLAASARELAEQTVSGMKVRDLKPERFRVEERKAGERAMRALRDNDLAKAAEEKRSQVLNFHLARAVDDAREKAAKQVRYLKGMGKKSTRERIGTDIELIDQLLGNYDLRSSPVKGDERARSLKEWYDSAVESEFEPHIDERLLHPRARTPYAQLAAEELTGLHDTVRSIAYIARERNTVTREGKKIALKAAVAELAERHAEHGVKFTEEAIRNPPQKGDPLIRQWLYRFATFLREAHSSLLGQDFKSNAFDLHQFDGAHRRYIFEPLNRAAYRKSDMTAEVTRRFEDMGKELGKAWQDSMTDMVPNEELADPALPSGANMKFTREKLIGMALHLGNESNFAKLTKGMGWEADAVWRFAKANMRATDWRAVQHIWDSFEPLWGESEAMIRRLGGVVPEKIPARPFDVETADGETIHLKGGYAPLDYDPRASDLAARFGALDEGRTLNEQARNYKATTTRNGSMKNRVEGYTDILNLNWKSSISRNIRDTIHDIAYREALLDIGKIMRDRQFRNSFQSAWGPVNLDALQAMIDNVRDTNRRDDAMNSFERIMRSTRQGVITVGIGYRLSTVLKHSSAAALKSLGYASGKGKKYFLARTARLATGNLKADFADAREKFPEIRFRLRQMDRDWQASSHALTERESVRGWLNRHGHDMVAYLDAISAVATAHAAYDWAITEGVPKKYGGTGEPMSHAEAVGYADKVVREAHGSALETTRSNFLHERGGASLLGMIYGFMNNTYGQLADIGSKARTPDLAKTPLLGRALATLIMPAVAASWVSEGGPQDAEGWAEWLALAIGGELAGTVPGVRDAWSAARRYSRNGNRFDFGTIPVFRVLGSAMQVPVDAWKELGGQDTRIIQHSFDALGMVFHIAGAGQAGHMLQYERDVRSGKQEPEGTADYMKHLLVGGVATRH